MTKPTHVAVALNNMDGPGYRIEAIPIVGFDRGEPPVDDDLPATEMWWGYYDPETRTYSTPDDDGPLDADAFIEAVINLKRGRGMIDGPDLKLWEIIDPTTIPRRDEGSAQRDWEHTAPRWRVAHEAALNIDYDREKAADAAFFEVAGLKCFKAHWSA